MMMGSVIRNRLLILLLISLLSMISSTNSAPNQSTSSNDKKLENAKKDIELRKSNPMYKLGMEIIDLIKDITTEKDIDVLLIDNRLNSLQDQLESLYNLNVNGTERYFNRLISFNNAISILKDVFKSYDKKCKLLKQDEKFQQDYTDIVKAIQDKHFELAENKLKEADDKNKMKYIIISAYKKSNYTLGNLLEFIDYIKEPQRRFFLYRTLYEYVIEINKDRVSKPNNIFNYDISTQCDLMQFDEFLKNDTKKGMYPVDMSENVGKIQNEFDEIFSLFRNRKPNENGIIYSTEKAERNHIQFYILFNNNMQNCMLCYDFLSCFPVPL